MLDVGDFRLESGVVLPGARGSDYHGYDFLIGPGRALDPAKFFIVAIDGSLDRKSVV